MVEVPVPPPAPPNVSLDRAVEAARGYLFDLSKKGLLGGEPKSVVLEEFKREANGDWVITLGYRLPPSSMTNPSMALIEGLRGHKPDLFRRFIVNGRTGEIVAMRSRDASGD